MSKSFLQTVYFALGLIACLAASPAHADSIPQGFYNHDLNAGGNPITSEGVTTFTIKDKVCSKKNYNDSRGENDCYNGNVRQDILFKKEARMGETMSYKFEIWIDPSLKYTGYSNGNAKGFLKYNLDSRLFIATWQGQYIHNFLYILKADTSFGVTFLGNVCQPRKDFGNWVAFEMKVHWSKDTKGWIDVLCDGKSIYSAKDVATNQAPHCYITNQCEPDKKKNASRILLILGPVMTGFGREWKKYGKESEFTPIQPEGITIKMRNISVTPIKN